MNKEELITFKTDDSTISARDSGTRINLEGSDGTHKASRRYRIYGPFQKRSFNRARRLVIAEILMQSDFRTEKTL